MLKRIHRRQLLFGPYRPPKVRRGDRLFCEIRGTVKVGGYHDAPIMWPRMAKGGAHTLILCGGLVKAVKRESKPAVAHHFGVSEATVRAWRRALGVPRSTEGTYQLERSNALHRKDDRLEVARRNSRTPEALAKASASLKGRIQSPSVIEAVRKAARRPRSEVWKQKMAAYWRDRGHPPGHPESRFWTAEEGALLGTGTDGEVARKIGRSQWAVRSRRIKKGIARY
jgi:hypothetical protein